MAELLLGGAAAAAGAAAPVTFAAGTGFTALASAAAPAATGLSTVLNILSGVATAASVIGALQSAQSDALQASTNAVQADLEAGQVQVQGEQQATELKRQLAKVLGENDVAIAAAGIDLGSGGIADTSRAAAKKATEDQLSLSRADDDMRRALLRARAQGYRTAASSYQAGGLLKAIGYGAGFGMDVLQRG